MTDDENNIGREGGDSKPLEHLAADNMRLMSGEQPQHMDTRGDRSRDVDLQAFREIMYALHAVSIGTHQLLYFSAMKYCKNYKEVQADSVDEVVEHLKEVFDRLNIGTLQLKEPEDGQKQKNKLLFELTENALTFDAGSDKPICYFISGYIAGHLENALDGRFVVNEISCTSQGDDACLFRAQQR